MLSLSSTTAYAVQALSHLSERGEAYTLAHQVATATEIPGPYLSKILNSLVHAGFVEGKRGYQGGFRMVRKPDELTLWEVVCAVEGSAFTSACPLGNGPCDPQAPCPAHQVWDELRTQFEKSLRRLTVADLATFERRKSLMKGQVP